jgi:hypothetical protein
VTILGFLAATVGLVGGAALIAVPKLVAFRVTMQTMSESSGAAASAMGKFGLFMDGPIRCRYRDCDGPDRWTYHLAWRVI